MQFKNSTKFLALSKKSGSALILLVGLVFQFSAAAAAPKGKIEYNRDIRPILSENCFACHGTDSASRKGDLRLDRTEDAVAPRKGSKPAIVPGRPNESGLISRIMTSDPDDIMPPAKSHKVLKPEEKDLLKRWISEGGKYEFHWSYLAPKRAPLPPVRNKSWVRNPIDQFVLARLEQEKLKPAAEADLRTLVRRVSLDLTGLPPTPQEVEVFLKDKSPKAYEKLVDRLLASPHWGEHRGRYWLDAARYADTHGIHFDNYREMWSYRDWVINAFNQNKRFDQFTIEQLAGDLLPNRTTEQQIATGFNRCNITSNEGGAIDEEYLVLYARDRTETTSQVWLGLTTGCAVCHDHKFDRFSQKEFYSLAAFFNNTTQKAMDGNIKDTPPTVFVPGTDDRAKWESLPAEKAEAKKTLEQRKTVARTEFNSWLTNAASLDLNLTRTSKEKLVAQFLLADDKTNSISATISGKPAEVSFTNTITWQEGAVGAKAFTINAATVPAFQDAGDFEREQSFTYAAWVRLGDVKDGALFSRIDDDKDFRGWDLWIEGGKPGTHIVDKWPSSALKVVSKKALEPNRWSHVCITYNGSAKASGVKIYIDGELQDFDVQNDTFDKLKVASIRTKVPFKIGQRSKSGLMDKAGIQDLRLYEKALDQNEVKDIGTATRLAWVLSKPAESRSKVEMDEIYTRWLISKDAEYQKASLAMDNLEKADKEIRMRSAVAHVMQERETMPEAYILSRGEYDKRKDKVVPETPAVLPAMSPDLPRNRLGIARWLLTPENPLTARTTVNRFWQELFGTGIVKTTGDLGVSGDMPSHPELLDWLAVEFRESGWDIKQFYKLMVTSAAYRQSAVTTPDKLAKDPQNRLISRGPRFRMDAEMIRDYALEASGLLVPKIGGPSVKPYQPDGVWETVAMFGSDTRDYKRDSGEKLYRRSLYTFWKRSAPPASMDVFNAPSRETCTVRRERTDTPLQALATLNDPQYVEAARHLAEQALKEGGSQEKDRLDFLARRLLSRSFRSDEQKITEAVLKDLLAHYKSATQDADMLITIGESKADSSLDKPTLAAYTMVANQLMNLDEVLNK